MEVDGGDGLCGGTQGPSEGMMRLAAEIAVSDLTTKGLGT